MELGVGDRPLQMLVEQQPERECRQENPGGHRQTAGKSTRDIADERREDDEGRGDDPRQRQPIEELGLADPAVADGIVAHERDRRVGAAEGQEPGLEAGKEQR